MWVLNEETAPPNDLRDLCQVNLTPSDPAEVDVASGRAGTGVWGEAQEHYQEKKISLVDVEKLLLHVGLYAAQYQALQKVHLKPPAFA